MYYKSKHDSHLVKITDKYILKVFNDSIIIHNFPTSAYIGDKYEYETEGHPIAQQEFEEQFQKTIDNIRNH
jgi:hypothetical protein